MKTKLLNTFLALLIGMMGAVAQTRIIGGYAVDITQRPFQAYINCGTQYGGGVIIGSQWILTAAHVVKNDQNVTFAPSDVQVVTGYTNLYDGMWLASSVSEIIVHPNYNRTTMDNDIALIKLYSPLSFGSTRQPIITGSYASTGTTAIISGWGRRTLAEGSADMTQLYAVPVTVQSTTTTKIAGKASASMPFKGDSGGPLTVNDPIFGTVLVGLASYVSGNNPQSNPVYYTNVPNYSSWIQTHTGISRPYLTGSKLVTARTAFSVENIQPGSFVSWSIADPTKASVDAQGIVTPGSWSKGKTNIQATVRTPWGSQYVLNQEIFVGFPNFEILVNMGDYTNDVFKTNTQYVFMADPVEIGRGRENILFYFQWRLKDALGNVISTSTLRDHTCLTSLFPVNIQTPGRYTLEVEVAYTPGGHNTFTRYLDVRSNFYFSVSADPSSRNIRIRQKENVASISARQVVRTCTAHLYKNNTLVRTVSFRPDSEVSIDGSNLSAGIYYLIITDGKEIVAREKVLLP